MDDITDPKSMCVCGDCVSVNTRLVYISKIFVFILVR